MALVGLDSAVLGVHCPGAVVSSSEQNRPDRLFFKS